MFTMPADLFKKAADAAVRVASTDAARPILAAVRFYERDGKLTMEATNSYVLARWVWYRVDCAKGTDLLIDRATLRQVVKHLRAVTLPRSGEPTVTVDGGRSSRHVNIRLSVGVGDGVVELSDVRLVDGAYPNVGMLLTSNQYTSPEDIDQMRKDDLLSIVANRDSEIKELLAAVKGAKAVDGLMGKLEAARVRAHRKADESQTRYLSSTRTAATLRWLDRQVTRDEVGKYLADKFAGQRPGLHTDAAFNPAYVQALTKAAEPIVGDHIPLRYYADDGVRPMHVWAVRQDVGRFDGMLMPVRV